MYRKAYTKGENMLSINATNFRKDMFNLLDQTIKYNEPVSITTKQGNAVLISEEDYNGMMETMYLISAGMEKSLIECKNTPLKDSVAESEVKW